MLGALGMSGAGKSGEIGSVAFDEDESLSESGNSAFSISGIATAAKIELE